MNTPNKLTVSRLILTVFFTIAFYAEMRAGKTVFVISTVLFILASFTDFLDGHLARKYNLVTDFGKFMDPLADKVLICAAMLVLIENSSLPAWMAILIISREYAITILRAIAASSGKVIAASKSGKLKTVTQIAGIVMMLLNTPYAFYMMSIATAITFYSGFEYIYINRSFLAG